MQTRHAACQRLARTYRVRCEWVPILLGGRYVVDGYDAGPTIRHAEQLARTLRRDERAERAATRLQAAA